LFKLICISNRSIFIEPQRRCIAEQKPLKVAEESLINSFLNFITV